MVWELWTQTWLQCAEVKLSRSWPGIIQMWLISPLISNSVHFCFTVFILFLQVPVSSILESFKAFSLLIGNCNRNQFTVDLIFFFNLSFKSTTEFLTHPLISSFALKIMFYINRVKSMEMVEIPGQGVTGQWGHGYWIYIYCCVTACSSKVLLLSVFFSQVLPKNSDSGLPSRLSV